MIRIHTSKYFRLKQQDFEINFLNLMFFPFP